MSDRRHALPPSLPPRGLSRAEAAAYIGISPTTFDAMVKDGRMPPAKQIGARTVWDRLQLDRFFAELPDAVVDGRPAEADDVWGQAAV
ncbi:Helix-turn-helix domain-containing protein [Filomicrobium insigne]|uniref:Helix-turn-helix domain-containing protein n=1 Tax=Filomicrobium insigne TaxID=418854 RepID=A0A1H0SBW2_9HYPH|nr:helix-turn-helix domain-containing protein [Filomicrobium insigne]SDP39301.1 Helix-turn-helix domain-containing protein [Filomicrobium insigne]